MNKYHSYAFLFLGALIYTLGHPNLAGILLPMMPIIGTSVLIYHLMFAKKFFQAARYFILFNIIITICSFYWITNTLQEFGNLPWAIAAIMNMAYAFIFTPHYWVFIITLFLIKKYKPKWEYKYFGTGLFSLVFAAYLTLIEYFIPQQFPILLGQPWIILGEYLGAAHIFGLPIYSFFSYLVVFEILRYKKIRRLSYLNISLIVLFVIANPYLVNLKPHKEIKTATKTQFNIRLVQANISNFLKVDSESGDYASVTQVMDAYKELSLRPFIDNERIDLVVWPETAYPYPIDTNKNDLTNSDLPPVFTEIAQKQMSELLIGGYDHLKDSEDGSYFMTEYNAAFFVDSFGKLKNTFHKHILIPFGETLPLGPLKKWASKHISSMAFFAEGEKYPLFTTEKGIKYFTTICYELIKPEFMRNYLNNLKSSPQVMINLTNDSWYGNTVEPWQHLFLARWRAIEFDLPIIRSTNTGVSAYVNRDGQIVRSLKYDIKGNLDLKVAIGPAPGPTIYQKYGFITILPIWIICFIFHFLLLKLKYVKKQ